MICGENGVGLVYILHSGLKLEKIVQYIMYVKLFSSLHTGHFKVPPFKNISTPLILAFEAKHATSPTCAFLQILAYYALLCY